MREILFRGFHKDKNGKQKVFVNGEWIRGEWVEGNYIYLHKTTYCFEGDTEHDKENEIHQIVFEQMTDWDLPNKHLKVDVIPETVGQYTGLTDKNGMKIFEGDIIRFDENLYTVQRECDTPGGYWAETGYILKHIGWSDYTSFTSTIDDWENECQIFIIGNIHDNPELLGGDVNA